MNIWDWADRHWFAAPILALATIVLAEATFTALFNTIAIFARGKK